MEFTRHFHREIEGLKRRLLEVASLAEESLRQAVQAVENRDPGVMDRLLEADREIDQLEVDVEEEGLKILALYQPVAVDLRLIVAILKINSDLERIGDLALNISKRARYIARLDPVNYPFDLHSMAGKAQEMLRLALDSLVNLDVETARSVFPIDDEVDIIHKGMYDAVKTEIRSDPSKLDSLIALLSISRNIERVADLTTNIAEDVLYMVEGRIVRHRDVDALDPHREVESE